MTRPANPKMYLLCWQRAVHEASLHVDAAQAWEAGKIGACHALLFLPLCMRLWQ